MTSTKAPILHDLTDGTFPSISVVFERFMSSAADAGVEREFAASILAEALAGDAAARELVEDTCGIEFL